MSRIAHAVSRRGAFVLDHSLSDEAHQVGPDFAIKFGIGCDLLPQRLDFSSRLGGKLVVRGVDIEAIQNAVLAALGQRGEADALHYDTEEARTGRVLSSVTPAKPESRSRSVLSSSSESHSQYTIMSMSPDRQYAPSTPGMAWMTLASSF